jgi:hypothetical protein
MHQATVPPCVRALTSFAAILGKGAAHAAARKIEPGVLLAARLYPDMFPLARQVMVASEIARGGALRLTGVEPAAVADEDKTFADLVARLHGTVATLGALAPAAFEGAEERVITWKTRTSTRELPGLAYLQTHVLPNVYFHVTTGYGILRHCGVEIGKQDFLGQG